VKIHVTTCGNCPFCGPVEVRCISAVAVELLDHDLRRGDGNWHCRKCRRVGTRTWIESEPCILRAPEAHERQFAWTSRFLVAWAADGYRKGTHVRRFLHRFGGARPSDANYRRMDRAQARCERRFQRLVKRQDRAAARAGARLVAHNLTCVVCRSPRFGRSPCAIGGYLELLS
jgi:hypothetical protein